METPNGTLHQSAGSGANGVKPLHIAPAEVMGAISPLASSPAQTGTSVAFRSLDVGVNHACGVLTSGKVVCWGGNDWGQATLPDGSFKAVSAGKFHGGEHGRYGSLLGQKRPRASPSARGRIPVRSRRRRSDLRPPY